MDHNPNISIIERFVAAVFSGDGETLKSLCDADFELHEGSGLAFAGTYCGGEGFLQFLGIFNETFDIERMETVRTYVTDDSDFVICEMELVSKVRATGEDFVSSLLERWHFRNGKVLDVKPHYFNAM